MLAVSVVVVALTWCCCLGLVALLLFARLHKISFINYIHLLKTHLKINQFYFWGLGFLGFLGLELALERVFYLQQLFVHSICKLKELGREAKRCKCRCRAILGDNFLAEPRPEDSAWCSRLTCD